MSIKRPHPRLDERLEGVKLRDDYNRQGESSPRSCAWKDCCAVGEYRAPLDRSHLRDYIWFCLDHVREYNRVWDYFAGMSTDEIEAHRRADTTWHRPSWQFGAGPGGNERYWHDPFEFFEVDPHRHKPAEPETDSKTLKMMRVLDLDSGFSESDLKLQYKSMVKRHHPDLHNGDKRAEERLKRINEAYDHLKHQFD